MFLTSPWLLQKQPAILSSLDCSCDVLQRFLSLGSSNYTGVNTAQLYECLFRLLQLLGQLCC